MKGKKVIGLAVFGDGRYGAYLSTVVRAYLTLFPGYELRIHHEDVLRTNYGRTLNVLHDRGLVRLIQMPVREGQGKCEKMLWRLAGAWDPDVEYVFSRDLDALPTWREREATEEFIASGLDASTIEDNPMHCGMMGGLCGFRADVLRRSFSSFGDFIARASFSDEQWAHHGADQHHLNRNIVPRMTVFEHSIHKQPTTRSTVFATSIAPFIDYNVPKEVYGPSNMIVPYMGVADYDRVVALEFYNRHCPIINELESIERQVGEVVVA
jgi:hypothetical protein